MSGWKNWRRRSGKDHIIFKRENVFGILPIRWEAIMNNLAYLLFILMGVIIYLLIDINNLLKINEVDICLTPNHILTISKIKMILSVI